MGKVSKKLPLFPVKLVTPSGVVLDEMVEQVTAVDAVGQFGVLADHVNFIAPLVPGRITITRSDGSELSYYATEGLAQVTNGAMTITVPELKDSASAEDAMATFRATQAYLARLEAERQEAQRALQAARRAMANSEVKLEAR